MFTKALQQRQNALDTGVMHPISGFGLTANQLPLTQSYVPRMTYLTYLTIPSSISTAEGDEDSSGLPASVSKQLDAEEQGVTPIKRRRGWWSSEMQNWSRSEMEAVLDKFGKEGLTPNTYSYLMGRTGRTESSVLPSQTLTGLQDKGTFKSPAKRAYQDVYTIELPGGSTGVRGIRNNNWGNIRISTNDWQGKVAKDQNTDGAFELFTTPEYGIRAMAINLRTYSSKYGKNTIADLISKWAPKNENKTASYIKNVAKWCGVDANEDVSQRLFNDDDFMLRLMYAIARSENGADNLNQINDVDGILKRGLAMANKRLGR